MTVLSRAKRNRQPEDPPAPRPAPPRGYRASAAAGAGARILAEVKVGGRTATGTPTRHATAGAQAVSVKLWTHHTQLSQSHSWTPLSLTALSGHTTHSTLVTAPRHVPSSFALLLNDW